MKPSLFLCIFALLCLAALLLACAGEDRSGSDLHTSDSITTHSPSGTPTAPGPAPESTPALTPSVSTTTVKIPESSIFPFDTTGATTGATAATTPTVTQKPVTVPPVTTTEAPIVTTPPPMTTATPPPPITTTTAKPPVTTTPPPTVTTAPPITTAPPTTTAPPAPEEPIDPAVHWVAICNEYINLRSEPSTAAHKICRIPKGDSMELLYFIGDYAKVIYKGKVGFVTASYITRPDGMGSAEDLTVVEFVHKYSYTQLQTDLAILAEKFPDRLTLSSIGTSEEGRDLTLAILGNPEAEHHIFMQAAIHGREHIGALLAVGEIDYILHHPDMVLQNGMTVAELLDRVAIHIVPMSNPDGVTISQTGTLPPPFADRYDSETAPYWKANALGIDLNANFDALWNKYESIYASTTPAYAGYKGTAPECAAESKALADYLRAGDFDLTLSYHTSGSLIYWSFDYANHVEVNEQSREIAALLSHQNGYPLGEQNSNSTAGLKDFAMSKLGIPSLTIEFALTPAPALFREYEQVWARAKNTLLISAQWVLAEKTAPAE